MKLGRSPARPGTAAYKPDAFSGSPSRAKNEQQRRVGHRIGQHLGGIENRDPSCAACLKVYMVMTRSEERRVGKECVRSVDLGGRRIIKKKNNKLIDDKRCERKYRKSNITTRK